MIGTLISKGIELLSEFIEDPDKRQEAATRMAEMANEVKLAEIELLKEQAKTNQEEAKHPSLFVSGWRPFVGWVSGISIAYEFLARPILNGLIEVAFNVAPFASIDTSVLITLITAMLGVAVARSWEGINGVKRSNMEPELKKKR